MGRSRVKKSAYQSWNPSILKQAIEAVKDRGMALRKASKIYGIPKTTLKRRIDEVDKPNADDSRATCHKRTVFTPEQENDLKKMLLTMAEACQGFTSKDIRYLAFHYAEKNGISHRFNKERGLAGVDWFYGFKERHPEIPLRSSELLSNSQSLIYKDKLGLIKFSEMLKKVLDKTKFIPHRVFNSEEYNVTSVEVALSVSSTAADPDVFSRAVICMSAGGTFLPPFISISSSPVDTEFEEQAPPGTIFVSSNRGWSETVTLAAWLKHFIRYAKPSEDDPALLFIKAESPAASNNEFLARAKENCVTIIPLPYEARQPLDISFVTLLNRFYNFDIENFRMSNPDRLVSLHRLNEFFGEAYLQASTPKTAIHGFKASGLYPFNSQLITEAVVPDVSKAQWELPRAIKRKMREDRSDSSGTDDSQNHNPVILSNVSSSSQPGISGVPQQQLNFPFELRFDTL